MTIESIKIFWQTNLIIILIIVVKTDANEWKLKKNISLTVNFWWISYFYKPHFYNKN